MKNVVAYGLFFILGFVGCKSRSFNNSAGNVQSTNSKTTDPSNPKLLTKGVVLAEVKDIRDATATNVKAQGIFDSTGLTHCDAMFLAGAKKTSWLEAKIYAGNKFFAKDQGPIQEILDYALGGGSIEGIKIQKGGAALSDDAISECQEYFKAMQKSVTGCAQFAVADYQTIQLAAGDSSILKEPFMKVSFKNEVSHRTYKAQFGMKANNGLAKEVQDQIIKAHTYFKGNKPDWKGYLDSSGAYLCNLDRVLDDANGRLASMIPNSDSSVKAPAAD